MSDEPNEDDDDVDLDTIPNEGLPDPTSEE